MSMGGVCAKIALREMELAGEDHETKVYISFDAPLRGANVSLGYQHLLEHLANIEIGPTNVKLRELVPKLDSIIGGLEAIAPQQMLVYHKNVNADDPNSPFRTFFSYFKGLEPIENCEHISISNGSQRGTHQGYINNDLLLELDVTESTLLQNHKGYSDFWGFIVQGLFRHFVNTRLDIEVKVWALPNSSSSVKKIYKGTYSAKIYGFSVLFSHELRLSPPGCLAIDNAPGGIISGFNRAPTDYVGLNIHQDRICFIPTVSALGIGPFQSQYGPFSSLYEDVLDNDAVLASGRTQLDKFIAIDDVVPIVQEENLIHPSFSYDNAGFLLIAVLNGSGLGDTNPLTTTFNFGEGDAGFDYKTATSPNIVSLIDNSGHLIDKNLTIEGNGKLWIAHSGKIAYVADSASPDNTATTFEVILNSGFCSVDPAIVNIRDNGILDIGEWNTGLGIENKGFLRVNDQANLHIENTGTATINNQSELIVEDGGKVTVFNGGLLEAVFGGKITIKSGAELHVKAGATLKIHGASQLIVEEGGKLIIEPNANIELWDGTNTYGQAVIDIFGELALDDAFNLSGNGYFKFEPGNVLSFSSAHIFRINTDLTTRFIEIAANAHLNIQGNSISLNDGIIKYNTLSSIKGGAGARLAFANIGFEGEETATAISADHAVQLVVNNCKFDNFGTGIDAYNVYSPLFFIENSVFQYNKVAALFITGAGTVRVNNSVFRGDNESAFAMLLTDISSFNLLNSTVEDFVNDHAIQLAEDIPEFVMSGGFIQNNTGAGIYVPPYSRSNIFLRDQATIADNGIGIFIENGAEENSPLDYGLVLMDCANLLNNGIGISGRDVLLQINAYDNLGDNDVAYLRPNHFQKPADGLMFDIFYQIRDEQEVSATGNYWGTDNAAFQNIGAPGHAPLFYNDLENGYNLIIPLIISNPVAQAPTGCPIPPSNPDTNPPSDKSCLLTGDGTFDGIIAHEEYAFAYRAFDEKLTNQSTTSDIKGMFGKLSGTSDGERSNASEACKQYIDVSKVMVSAEIMKADIEGNNIFLSGANDTGKALFQSNKQQKGIQEVQDIHLFPNPAKNEFQIQLPNTFNKALTTYQVNIFDNLGKNVFFEETDENLLVKTSRWTAGLYYVVLTAKASGEVTSLKIIVE